MGSCISKKNAKKKQLSPASEPNAHLKGTPSPPTLSQPTPCCSKQDVPSKEKAPPEEEAVKEILSEIPKANPTNSNQSAGDDIREKPLVEEVAAVKDSEHHGLKKKGSFKKDKVKKDQAVQEGSSLTTSSSAEAKEDVDAILIQCGRLSRSSSGKASNETQPRLNKGSNQYSGSKRHAAETKDEDQEQDQDQDQDRVVPKESRNKPSHRRSSSRDLTAETKRSSSRDRGTEEGKRVTGRRISPSPGRRPEPSPGRRSETSVEKTRPGKQNLTSRETTSTSTFEARKRSATSVKRATNSGEFSGGHTSSTRSRSPAPRPNEGNFPSSLSRSSSRKTEQSPCRRAPNEEAPGNQIRDKKDEEDGGSHGENSYSCDKTHENNHSENAEAVQKETSSMAQMDGTETNTKERLALKEITGNGIPIRDQLLSCRAAPSMKAPSKVSTKEPCERASSEETETAKCSAKHIHRRIPSSGSDFLEAKETLNESMQPMDGPLVSSANLLKAPSNQLNGTEERWESEGSMQFSRSRSSRRSRDQLPLFEAINPSLNSSNTDIKTFSIPASVSKARSILEAVADLNSSVNSNSSIYSTEKSLVSAPLERGKSARFLLSGNFGAESNSEKAKFDSQKDNEIERNTSARNSNAEHTEQIQEESAGSNDNSMYQAFLSGRVPESADRLTARRLHRYLSSEEGLAPDSLGNEGGEDISNSNNNTSLKEGNGRYFNISPEEVILNPYLGIKPSAAEECLSRSSFVPVITLSKKEFQNSKQASKLQNARTCSERSKQNAHQQNYHPNLDLKVNSRTISDPGKPSFLTNSSEDQYIVTANSTNSSSSANKQIPKESDPVAISIHSQKNDLTCEEQHQHTTLSPADILYLLENVEYDEEEFLSFMNNNARYGGGRRSHCSENASSEASFEFKIKSVSSTPRSTPSFSAGSTPSRLRNINSVLLTADEITEIWGTFEIKHHLNSP